IKAIIMDLKGSGRLRGTFSSTTGKMQLAEIKKQPEKASKVIVTTSEDNRFCKECGTEVDKNDNAQFCPYCGSKIER
ncbi:MAG: zinc-ribbon domain-containing protein, partial [Promethearchaeota archaeon]